MYFINIWHPQERNLRSATEWRSHIKDFIISAITNIIWIVRFFLEKIKFVNVRLDTNHLLHRIKNDVIISTNISKGTMNSSIQGFKIFKSFGTTCHVPNAFNIIKVDLIIPPMYWIQCNTDGVSRGFDGITACVEIFRDDKDSFLGVYSQPLGVTNFLNG